MSIKIHDLIKCPKHAFINFYFSDKRGVFWVEEFSYSLSRHSAKTFSSYEKFLIDLWARVSEISFFNEYFYLSNYGFNLEHYFADERCMAVINAYIN